MNQEITISRNTISYIADNLPAFEVNNAQLMIEKLKENYCVIDSKFEFAKLLWEETKKTENEELRKYLQRLLQKLFTEKKSLIQCTFEKEEILSQKSSDKIFLDPLLDSKSIKKIEKKYSLETHNDSSFINPSPYQKLKHSNCKLVLERSVIYDFKRIFEPYLRKTKTLIIEDPFLPNPKAFNNLKQLIELFNGNDIKVKLHSEHNYLKYNPENKENYSKLQTYLNTLELNGLKVSIINFEKRKHYERFIFTDSVRIKLPGGLDFLDQDGKINSNESTVEIEISKK